MTNEQHQVPGHYIPQLVQYLDAKHISSDAWLQSCNIDKHQVLDPELLLDFTLYKKLIHAAVQMSKEPSVGLQAGKAFSYGSHGVLGFALLNSHTLGEALNLFARYIKTRAPYLRVDLLSDNETLNLRVIDIWELGEVRRPILESVAVALQGVVNFLLPSQTGFEKVGFDFEKPEHWTAYKDFFNCPVTFSQEYTELSVPMSVAQIELSMSDEQALNQAIKLCEQEMRRIESCTSFAERVEEILMLNKHHFLSLEQVAEQLNLTPRTLHRKLVKEGTKFKSLLELVKHRLAKQYLAQRHFTVHEVSYLLGYGDVANFRRAFKSWQKQSPQEYRETLFVVKDEPV